jgi:hypothetical protein
MAAYAIKHMKTLVATASILTLVLAGCHTAPDAKTARDVKDPIELSENEVLKHTLFGRKGAGTITPQITDTGKFAYHTGSRILLIQSGQESPDEALLAALRKTYMPIPISGVNLTLEACLRIEPEDLNYDYNDLGTGAAANSARWPVLRDRGTSGNTGGKLHEAIRNVALDSGADTVVIVWTSTKDPKNPAFRAAIVNAFNGDWEVVSPYAGTVGPAKLAPENKSAAYEALARILEAKKDGVSYDKRERD